MPRPPILPVDNTARLIVHYDNGLDEHTFLMRLQTGESEATLISQARDFCTLLASHIPTTSAFDSAVIYHDGDDISSPVSWASIPGTWGSSPDPSVANHYVSFVGRDHLGYRTKLFFFDPFVTFEDDLRYERGDSGEFDDVLDLLQGGSSVVGTISGAAPVWKDYVNAGFHRYWQKQQRKRGP